MRRGVRSRLRNHVCSVYTSCDHALRTFTLFFRCGLSLMVNTTLDEPGVGDLAAWRFVTWGVPGHWSVTHGKILWNNNNTGRCQYFKVRTTSDRKTLRINNAYSQVTWFVLAPSLHMVSIRSLRSTYGCWVTGELLRAMVSSAASRTRSGHAPWAKSALAGETFVL
jgi:hypothetical protein